MSTTTETVTKTTQGVRVTSGGMSKKLQFLLLKKKKMEQKKKQRKKALMERLDNLEKTISKPSQQKHAKVGRKGAGSLKGEQLWRYNSKKKLDAISKNRKWSMRQKSKRIVKHHTEMSKKFSAFRFGPFKDLVRERLRLQSDTFSFLGKNKTKTGYPMLSPDAVNLMRSIVNQYGVDTCILMNQNKLFRSHRTLKPSRLDFLFAQTQIGGEYGPEYLWKDLVLPEVEKKIADDKK